MCPFRSSGVGTPGQNNSSGYISRNAVNREDVIPVNHVESFQVSQGFADLKGVEEQRGSGHDVLLLRQIAPQLSRGTKSGTTRI